MTRKKKKLRVYVLMGGKSAEHDISLKSGAMVLKNLDTKKFNVVPVLITKTGRWLIGERKRAQYRSAAPPQLFQNTARSRLLPGPAAHTVAFIAMHGPYGEDGTLQGLLELAGIPYTGSGVLASALAMDKVLSAEIFERHGIRVPRFVAFSKSSWKRERAALRRRIAALGWPLVVKPRNLGSSVGVTIVQKPSELCAAVRRALSYSSEIMAQKYIKGKELTCGVIDRGTRGSEQPLQPTEIISKSSAFFDYHAKYTPGASQEITPPQLPTSMIKKIQETALACHRVLGCSGMSRTDMILSNGKLYVLEVNTIPGMTETSLLPQAAKACGISFPQLLERIIFAAINRVRYNYN